MYRKILLTKHLLAECTLVIAMSFVSSLFCETFKKLCAVNNHARLPTLNNKLS